MASNKGLVLVVASLCTLGIALALGSKRSPQPNDKACLGFQQPTIKQPPTEPLANQQEAWALPVASPIDAHQYQNVLARIEVERVALASRFQRATSAAQRAEVIAQARIIVSRHIYTEIFPSWYGTPWDFYGTSEVPQEGKIACGYFVSTVLRDAGWKVQRARLAQQASENIILSLTDDPYVKRFRRVAISDFITSVREWGPGIYVVGLDVHTGFIVNTGGEVYFIHSSYIEPHAVVREKASDSAILAASKYRVLGRVTADDRFIESWLLRKEIVTRSA